MNITIKDALVRISRSLRSLGAMYNGNQKPVSRKQSLDQLSTCSSYQKSTSIQHISNEENIHDYKSLVTNNYRRKIHQDFLKPLEISNLKTFDDNRPKYDVDKAILNWKMSKKRGGNFGDEKIKFQQMMDLLVELTPDYLKLSPTAPSSHVLHLIETQKEQNNRNRFQTETPRYHFHEVPPIPANLTQRSFQKYIYYLCHSKILYQNSGSLENGLVPDILLFTHNLNQPQFKPFRSVHTFNYLIKYFGYDKNQSSFARELLLIMTKDGHKPNIDTINALLKLCQIHSTIRSTTSTYPLICKYLRLSKELGLEINLTTWARIYDSINNIFFKEIFIDTMNSINLPITKSLLHRILDDFIQTTKNSQEVIEFVEEDLKIKNWKQDSQISNRIFQHRLQNNTIDELKSILRRKFKNEIVDAYSFNNIMKKLAYDNAPNNIVLIMLTYITMRNHFPTIQPAPELFRFFIDGLNLKLKWNHISINEVMFITRCLIHIECVNIYNLPTEINTISVFGGKENKGPPENYKIMRRLVGTVLNEIEGRYLYSQGKRWSPQKSQIPDSKIDSNIKLLRTPVSIEEIEKWDNFKAQFDIGLENYLNLEYDEKLNHFFKDNSNTGELTSNHQQDMNLHTMKYLNVHKNRVYSNTVRNRLERLGEGNETYILKRMRKRGILANIE